MIAGCSGTRARLLYSASLSIGGIAAPEAVFDRQAAPKRRGRRVFRVSSRSRPLTGPAPRRTKPRSFTGGVMDNPVLVEVTRGAEVESRHRGAVSVVDAEGTAVAAVGDVECRVYPRSAVKALQALPLVEGGFADKYGLTEAEIALACASHAGEPEHVAAAAAM